MSSRPASTEARLQQALDQLLQGEGAVPESLLRELAAPVTLACVPGAVPAFHTLPLSQQADLLLLLRAAPHKFPRPHVGALLSNIATAPQPQQTASLVQHLIQGLQDAALDGPGVPEAIPVVGPCPDFLFTPSPAFPWTPRLVEAGLSPLRPQAAAPAAVQASKPPTAMAAPSEALQWGPAGSAAAYDSSAAAPSAAVDAAGAEGRKRPSSRNAEAAAPVEAAAPAKRRRSGAAAALHDEEEYFEDGEAGAAVRGQDQPPVLGPQGNEAPAGVGLAAATAGLQQALEALGAAGAAAGGASLEPGVREALGAVLSAAASAGAAGAALLSQAGLGASLGDDALLVVAREAVGPTSTFARCTLVAAGVLLPKLLALDSPPSRALAAAVEHLGSTNPQALLHSCFRPLLSTPGFNQHQAELVARSAKDWLPPSLLPDLVEAACSGGGGSAPLGSHWNEQVVGLVQAVLGTKPELPQAALQSLAHALQGAAAVEQLQASVKFVKLVMTAVKQYSEGLRTFKPQLQAAASSTKTFMTKSTLAAVAKL